MYDNPAHYKIVSYHAMCNDVKLLGRLTADMLIMDDMPELEQISEEDNQTEAKISEETTESQKRENESKNETSQSESKTPESDNGEQKTENNSQKLISQGLSFLSGLAETLKSPEATKELIDNIVETDVTTGKSSIKIPVESKESVEQVFNIFQKLFSGINRS